MLGVVLLSFDIAGRLRADGFRLLALRSIAIAAATIAAFAPLFLWKTGRISVGLGFEPIAYAYVLAFVVYLFGLLVFPRLISRWISRIGYVFLLALASLPSFVLIVLVLPAGIAGLGLVRPIPKASERIVVEDVGVNDWLRRVQD